MVKLPCALLSFCLVASLIGCGTMPLYSGPERGKANLAQVYLHASGDLPLSVVAVNEETHAWASTFKEVGDVLPGKSRIELRSEDFASTLSNAFEVGCGNHAEKGTYRAVVTFEVDLAAGHSYFATTKCNDSVTLPTACLYEELTNDQGARSDAWGKTRIPQHGTKPLQCGSLQWASFP
jgi:hypothetical protein